jgi:hypothetical protein
VAVVDFDSPRDGGFAPVKNLHVRARGHIGVIGVADILVLTNPRPVVAPANQYALIVRDV